MFEMKKRNVSSPNRSNISLKVDKSIRLCSTQLLLPSLSSSSSCAPIIYSFFKVDFSLCDLQPRTWIYQSLVELVSGLFSHQHVVTPLGAALCLWVYSRMMELWLLARLFSTCLNYFSPAQSHICETFTRSTSTFQNSKIHERKSRKCECVDIRNG